MQVHQSVQVIDQKHKAKGRAGVIDAVEKDAGEVIAVKVLLDGVDKPTAFKPDQLRVL